MIRNFINATGRNAFELIDASSDGSQAVKRFLALKRPNIHEIKYQAVISIFKKVFSSYSTTQVLQSILQDEQKLVLIPELKKAIKQLSSIPEDAPKAIRDLANDDNASISSQDLIDIGNHEDIFADESGKTSNSVARLMQNCRRNGSLSIKTDDKMERLKVEYADAYKTGQAGFLHERKMFFKLLHDKLQSIWKQLLSLLSETNAKKYDKKTLKEHVKNTLDSAKKTIDDVKKHGPRILFFSEQEILDQREARKNKNTTPPTS